MRKHRGWSGNGDIAPIQVAKPSLLTFQLTGNVVLIKWLASIGCIEGYRVYGGKSAEQLIQIAEINNNNYTWNLSTEDFPYFIAVSAFYQANESEKTAIIKVRDGLTVNIAESFEKVVNEIVHELTNNEQQSLQNTISTPLQPSVNQQLPYGTCSCCTFPHALMKRKEKIVCSRNLKQIYIQNGPGWIMQPQQIVSDVEQMDELLRQNTAYVGIGGILVNNQRY